MSIKRLFFLFGLFALYSCQLSLDPPKIDNDAYVKSIKEFGVYVDSTYAANLFKDLYLGVYFSNYQIGTGREVKELPGNLKKRLKKEFSFQFKDDRPEGKLHFNFLTISSIDTTVTPNVINIGWSRGYKHYEEYQMSMDFTKGYWNVQDIFLTGYQ